MLAVISDLCDDEEPYSFKVVFLGEAGREYIMHAESHEQMEGWMRSISSASYEYITLMVAEMQKQLDEITSEPLTWDQGSLLAKSWLWSVDDDLGFKGARTTLERYHATTPKIIL